MAHMLLQTAMQSVAAMSYGVFLSRLCRFIVSQLMLYSRCTVAEQAAPGKQLPAPASGAFASTLAIYCRAASTGTQKGVGSLHCSLQSYARSSEVGSASDHRVSAARATSTSVGRALRMTSMLAFVDRCCLTSKVQRERASVGCARTAVM